MGRCLLRPYWSLVPEPWPLPPGPSFSAVAAGHHAGPDAAPWW